MNWISNPFTKYGRNVHFVLIALLTVTLIYADETINGFVSGAVARVFHGPFSYVKNSIVELVVVHEENARLQLRLAEASRQLWNLEEDRLENTRLRNMLGFEPPEGYSLLPAEVISVFGDEFPTSAVINRGIEDSILVNQTVINEDGLIGRVVAVMPGSATVQLLTDPANRVATKVVESRDMGIARYLASGKMILDHFPIQGEVKPGDMIVSSGLGGVYPPGLIVGTVSDVDRPEEEPFCDVALKASANFFRLEELFILKPEVQ